MRRLWVAAAVLAAGVAILFATVGDGVGPDPSATGWRRTVLEHGHTLVWMLLAGALTWAAVAGRWARASSLLAGAALACYAVFLGVLLV